MVVLTTSITEHVNAYFAPRNGLRSPWVKCRIVWETRDGTILVKFCDDTDDLTYEYPQYYAAPNIPPDTQLMSGTRVIAERKSNSKQYYAGVVGETISRSNDFMYLIFFDFGHVRYARSDEIRVVCGNDGWKHVDENAVKFFRYYFNVKNPSMVSDKIGDPVKVSKSGKWYFGRIVGTQGDLLILIEYNEIAFSEWLYRGSPRFGPIWRKYLNESGFSWEDTKKPESIHDTSIVCAAPQNKRSPKRKSQKRTVTRCRRVKPNEQMGYLSPKKNNRHKCSPMCCPCDKISEGNLTKFGPLMQPMIIGYKRVSKSKISYVTPCGKSISSSDDMKTYLNVIECETFDIDNFCFDKKVDCLRVYQTNCQFVVNEVRQWSITVYMHLLEMNFYFSISGHFQWR